MSLVLCCYTGWRRNTLKLKWELGLTRDGGGWLENSSVFTGEKKVLYCVSNRYTDEVNHLLEIIVPSISCREIVAAINCTFTATGLWKQCQMFCLTSESLQLVQQWVLHSKKRAKSSMIWHLEIFFFFPSYFFPALKIVILWLLAYIANFL